MRKLWLVIKREFLFNLKQKSFLFTAFGVPLLLMVVFFVIFSVIDSNQGTLEEAGTIGYVDHAGVLAAGINKPDTFVPYASEDEARKALDDRTLGAYFVVPENYMVTGSVQIYNYGTSSEVLKDAIGDFLLTNLTTNLDSSIPLDRAKNPVNLTIHIEDSGRTLEGQAFISLFITPIIFGIVFTMATQLSSGFLMNGVVEEKTNRIMEILVTSVTPMQMLLGKIIGLGLLGLLQLAVWGVFAFIASQISDQVTFLKGVIIPPDLIFFGVIYFVLGYFLLGSIMAGIGAVSGSEEESRQYSAIFSVILSIPFFAFIAFISDPNGTLPIVLSLIPFTAPLAMILRMSFGAVPLAQILLSVAILLLTTIFIAWSASKVFRWGLLLYGQKLSLREIWRVIRQSGTQVATVAAKSTQET